MTAREKKKAQRKAKNKKAFVDSHKQSGCSICGYNKCLDALSYHHIENSKRANIARLRTVTKVKQELPKCILVCANCHAEIHAGMHEHIPVPTYLQPEDSNQIQWNLFDAH